MVVPRVLIQRTANGYSLAVGRYDTGGYGVGFHEFENDVPAQDVLDIIQGTLFKEGIVKFVDKLPSF